MFNMTVNSRSAKPVLTSQVYKAKQNAQKAIVERKVRQNASKLSHYINNVHVHSNTICTGVFSTFFARQGSGRTLPTNVLTKGGVYFTRVKWRVSQL